MPGRPLNDGTVRKLEMFAEKPDQTGAKSYIAQGYLWNSGNFLFQASVMKDELNAFQPAIWKAAEDAVGGAIMDVDFLRLAEIPFAASPKISIDYAVMEKTKVSAVVPVDMGWSDLGSWDAIWVNAKRDQQGNALSGPCEVLNVKNAIIQSDDSILTTVVGLSDILVVSSADAVLVAPRGATGEIKTLVEKLKASGRTEATEHRRVARPWGHRTTISKEKLYRVSRIVVSPNRSLSLQNHQHRSEHWIVVSGKGEITINGETSALNENQSIYIPIGARHLCTNTSSVPLELIQVQIGSTLTGKDIERDAQNDGI
jgi:mannose-1-phosphate guanylyltransferase/mannose-6-phosphate isomerase